MGEDIHRWMDEPIYIISASKHRRFRHDPDQELPLKLSKKYGRELATNIMISHLVLDEKESRKRKKKKTKKHPIIKGMPRQTLDQIITWIENQPSISIKRKTRMMGVIEQQAMGVTIQDISHARGVTSRTIGRDLSFIRDNFKRDT